MTTVYSTPSRCRRLQNYLLVWVDERFDASSSDSQHALQQLRTVVNDVTTFTEPDACIRFLHSVQHENVLVIVSDMLAPDLVPQIHSMVQVDTIYIFCGDQAPQNPLFDQCPKVKDVYIRIEPICKALQQSTTQCDRDSTPISFVRPTTSDSTPNADELELSFMYTQLFKDALLHMNYEPQARDALVRYCRDKKADLPSELKTIEEFERDYSADKAIWWYTRECFIYQMLNRALRLLETDIIVNMGFFVHDLHRQIEQLHRARVNQYEGQTFKLYRGQGLWTADFHELKSTVGGLLSFNSFLSTNKDRKFAKISAESSSRATGKVGIIFVLTIDPTLKSTPFADIGQLSYFGEKEGVVLFSMLSVFRIDRLKDLDDGGRLWEVEMTLITDDDAQLGLLTGNIDVEVKSCTRWQRIAQLLLSLRQVEQVEEMYMTLLDQTSSETDKANYSYQMGRMKNTQGDYKAALLYYERALDIRQRTVSASEPDLATTLSSIGSVYSAMHEYEKALSYYEKALTIRQKTFPDNHPSLATVHNNIGSVYSKMGEYKKALACYERALNMQQRTLPDNHPDLATAHNNIGSLYSNMGEYSRALTYHEKALDMQKKALPADHSSLATSLGNIGFVYSAMDEYEKALSYYEKALDIRQKTLPDHHPDLANAHNNIGSVYSAMGNYEKALLSYERALHMQQRALPDDHPHLATSLNNIGSVYSKMGEHSKALPYYEKAIDMQKKTLPADHPSLATSLGNIGFVYSTMGMYENALSYHEKALDMKQKVLPPNHPSLAVSLDNIGFVYSAMGEYESALSYHERALDVQQRILPANHADLAVSLNSIGSVYSKMGEHSKALPYYENALDIWQNTLPADHPSLVTSYNTLALMFMNMEEHEKALFLYGKALDIREKTLQENHPDLATTLHNIGEVYYKEKKHSEALSYSERALKIRQHSLPPAHPDIQTSLKLIESVKQCM